MNKPNDKTIGVRLSEEDHAELSGLAEKLGIPMASFINQALECMMDIVKAPPCTQTTKTIPKFLALSRIRYHWGEIEGIDLQMTLTPNKANEPDKI